MATRYSIFGRTSCTLFAGLLALVNPALAVDRFWNNPAGGSWGTTTNWTPNGVPGIGDRAIIELAGTYAVTLNVNANIDELRLGALSGTQTLTVSGIRTMTLAANSTVRPNGRINVPAATSLLLTLPASVDLTMQASTNQFTVGGTFHRTGLGIMFINVPTLNSGQIRTSAGATTGGMHVLANTSGPGLWTSAGNRLLVDTPIFLGRVIEVVPGSVSHLDVDSTNMTLSGGPTDGLLNITGGIASVFNASTVVAQDVEVCPDPGDPNAIAELDIVDSASSVTAPVFNICDGGELRGSGFAHSPVQNAGRVAPGRPPLQGDETAILHVDDYAQSATGSLNIDLGGTALADYDRLESVNTVALDGTLNVSLTGGFVPEAGDSFDVLVVTSGTLGGTTFAQVNAAFPSGLALNVEYLTDRVRLHIVSLLWNTGIPRYVLYNPSGGIGTPTYLGFSSGIVSPSLPQRWLAQPFTLAQDANLTAVEVYGFVPAGSEYDDIVVKLWRRPPDSGGNPTRPTIQGGDLLHDISISPAPAPIDFLNSDGDPNVDDPNDPNWRLHIPISVSLAAGRYYATVHGGTPTPPNTTSNFAWFANAPACPDGIAFIDTTGQPGTVVPPPWPYMWRSAQQPSPGYGVYQLNNNPSVPIAPTYYQDPAFPHDGDPGTCEDNPDNEDLYVAGLRIEGAFMPPCPGDLDGNGQVDLADLSTSLSNFGSTNAGPEDGDFDGDNSVNLSDLAFLLGNYGTVCR